MFPDQLRKSAELPEPAAITGCNSAVAMMERMPCTPTSVTARSMLSMGWLLTRYIALFAMRSRLPVSAGSCAMMREISTMVACGSLTVAINFGSSDGRRGMYSGRASMRSRICCDRLEHGRMLGIGRLAQRLARCVVERVGDEAAQRFVPVNRRRCRRWCCVPVSVRLEPVVDAMGSTGAGFWRVARRYTQRPTTATNAPPIKTATDDLMARGYPFAGPPARRESRSAVRPFAATACDCCAGAAAACRR